jgi:hypothetical protein
MAADRFGGVLGPDEQVEGLTVIVRLPEGLTISGFVLNELGNPIAQARIDAHMTVPPYNSGWAKSEPDGFFAIHGLDEHEFRLEATHLDYGRAYRLNIPAGSEDVEIKLSERGDIAGQVLHARAKTPIQSFEILRHVPSSSDHPGMVQERWESIEDAEGRFIAENLNPGETIVSIRAQGFASTEVAVEVVAGTMQDGIIIHLATERVIHGTVLNENGDPLVGARIFAGALPNESDFERRTIAHSGARGEFYIEGLSEDLELISVQHHGYAPDFARLDSNSDDVEITLSPGIDVSGQVFLDGAPLAGASVGVALQDPRVVTMSARSDSDGRYRIEHVPSGSATLFAFMHIGGTGNQINTYSTVEIGNDGVSDQDFQFFTYPTELRGTITEEGKLQPGLFVRILYENGQENSQVVDTHTTAEGRLEIDHLPPGPCVIRIYPPGANDSGGFVDVGTIILEGAVTVENVAY